MRRSNNQYKVLRTESAFDDTGLEVARVNAIKARSKYDAREVAIHLRGPVTKARLDDAFETAFRDGFKLIVVHTKRTWPN